MSWGLFAFLVPVVALLGFYVGAMRGISVTLKEIRDALQGLPHLEETDRWLSWSRGVDPDEVPEEEGEDVHHYLKEATRPRSPELRPDRGVTLDPPGGTP